MKISYLLSGLALAALVFGLRTATTSAGIAAIAVALEELDKC